MKDIQFSGNTGADACAAPQPSAELLHTKNFCARFVSILAVRQHLMVCRDSERSCYHVELDMSGSAASYEAGDHVGIYVENNTDIVEKVCRLLQHSPDTILQFKHPPGNPDRLAPCPAGVDAHWTEMDDPLTRMRHRFQAWLIAFSTLKMKLGMRWPEKLGHTLRDCIAHSTRRLACVLLA